MKRCPHQNAALLLALAMLSGLAAAPAAVAQTTETKPVARVLPKAALRADMVVVDAARIILNDKPERLAPGVRIRGADNQLVFATRLVNQTLDVKYVRATGGMIQQVWVLNSEEAKEARNDSLLDRIGELLGLEPAPAERDRTPYAERPAYESTPAQRSTRVYTDLPAYDSKGGGYDSRPAYGDKADKVRPAYGDLPAYQR